MLKRLTLLAMTMIMALTMIGCGGGDNGAAPKNQQKGDEVKLLGSETAKTHLKVGTTTAPDGPMFSAWSRCRRSSRNFRAAP